MNNVVDLYRTVAEDFAKRAVTEIKDEIRAIVPYGSVARGEASDIDMLVVAARKDSIRLRVVQIEEALDAETDYRTFLVSSYLTLEETRCLLLDLSLSRGDRLRG